MSSGMLLDAIRGHAVTPGRAGSIGRALGIEGVARGETLNRRYVGGLSRGRPCIERAFVLSRYVQIKLLRTHGLFYRLRKSWGDLKCALDCHRNTAFRNSFFNRRNCFHERMNSRFSPIFSMRLWLLVWRGDRVFSSAHLRRPGKRS